MSATPAACMEDGNSVTVPIKVAAIGGSNGYKLIETVADLSEGKYFMAGADFL